MTLEEFKSCLARSGLLYVADGRMIACIQDMADVTDCVEKAWAELQAVQAAAYKKLDGDSLDAIVEVCGEGDEFQVYNNGKSMMRSWFLRRLPGKPEEIDEIPDAT